MLRAAEQGVGGAFNVGSQPGYATVRELLETMHDADVTAVHRAGFTARPLRDTLADTWAWLQAEGDPQPRPDAPPPEAWFDTSVERELVDRLTRS